MMNKTPHFINPYNFIPLEEEAPERGEVKRGNRSGVISYFVLTKTPLFIPNTSSDDAFKMEIPDHKSYDFFSLEDLSKQEKSVEDVFFEPIIPGSEMRGLLRSNFEILSNSCLGFYSDPVLSKRTLEAFKAGLIKRTVNIIEDKETVSYQLYEAVDCLMRLDCEDMPVSALTINNGTTKYSVKSYRQKNLKEGQKVLVRVLDRNSAKPLVTNIETDTNKLSNGWTEGYILKGEDGPANKDEKSEKHNCHVFLLREKKLELKELAENEINILSVCLQEYKTIGDHNYSDYSKQWEIFKGGKSGSVFFPVYYSCLPRKQYLLAPACYTREIYSIKLSNILKEHKKCCDENNVCPSCALFGTIGNDGIIQGEKKLNISSRVRVADLTLIEKHKEMFVQDSSSLFCDVTTIAPLSSPKINNMEFYVQRPNDNAYFWTYDYYISKNDASDQGLGVVKSGPIMVNGRKFYWHQPTASTEKYAPTKLNTTIRPLKEGVCFEGKIYFDNLTERELEMLIYSINTGDDQLLEEKTHGLKLGHGKPLGYGSIALQVGSVHFRTFSEGQYIITPYEGEPNPKEYILETTLSNYELMTRFTAVNDWMKCQSAPIKYPQKNPDQSYEDSPIYEWFTENHAGFKYRTGEKRYETNDSPQKREQMYYREYMKAMQPELMSTVFPQSVLSEKGGKDYSSKKTKTRDKRDSEGIITVRLMNTQEDPWNTKGLNKAQGYIDGQKRWIFDVPPDKDNGDEVSVRLVGKNYRCLKS